MWAVHVHAANNADTVEGCVVADLALADLQTVRGVCADKGYRGTFFNHVRDGWNLDVHISGREGKGFEVEPKRWVVERTFSWFNGQRRLSKDYEKDTTSSEAMLYIASISRLLRGHLFN